MSMKILLSGATGRIGRRVEALVAEADDAEIVARATRDRFFPDTADADVLIDFSRPALCRSAVAYAAERGVPCVVGTTGLDDDAEAAIAAACRGVAVCVAANFSVGINLLLMLAERAGAGLGDEFDVEIGEIHHRWKTDAPSGTALELGRAVARGRGLRAQHAIAEPRTGPRRAGEIGYQSARGGDVAGEHAVRFLGDGERVELVHAAGDPAVFARGALRAARWLRDRRPGRYAMADVLGDGDA